MTELHPPPKEELVLFCLQGRELYGRQLPIAVKECSGGKVSLPEGTIYPVLHILAEKRLVKFRWGDEPTNRAGSRRKYYRLTEAGEATVAAIEAFRLKLSQWEPKSESSEGQE